MAAQHEDRVQVHATRTHASMARDAVGSMQVRMAFSPDGRYAGVANGMTADVSSIDIDARWEVARSLAGIHPDGIGSVSG